MAEEVAEAATAEARAVMGAARAAVKAVEQMLDNKARSAREAAERKAQGQIDEVAGRTRSIKEL